MLNDTPGQVLATYSGKHVERMRNPKADLTDTWMPDRRNAAVEKLGFGVHLSDFVAASEEQSLKFWQSESDKNLKTVQSFYATSTVAITEAAAAARIREMKSHSKRLKELNRRKLFTALPKSNPFADDEDDDDYVMNEDDNQEEVVKNAEASGERPAIC